MTKQAVFQFDEELQVELFQSNGGLEYIDWYNKGSHQKKCKKISHIVQTMGGGEQILVCEPQKSDYY